jgi:hypothetical protein
MGLSNVRLPFTLTGYSLRCIRQILPPFTEKEMDTPMVQLYRANHNAGTRAPEPCLLVGRVPYGLADCPFYPILSRQTFAFPYLDLL